MCTSARAFTPPSRVGQKHDVRLEPLGLVQVHQPHDVRAPGLERERLDFARRLAVGFERIGRIGEAAAGFDDLAHAVDGVEHVARVDTAGRRRRQREVAAGFEDPFERAGRREHAGPAVVVIQGVERGTDAVGSAAEARPLRRRPVGRSLNQPPDCLNANSSGSLMPKSGPRSTATSESGSCGIGQRAQQLRERLDLARFAKRAGAAHLGRDVQRFERGGVRSDAVALLPRQDQEIAELPPAGIDLRTDVGRNPCRIHRRKLRRFVAVVRQRAHLAANGLLRLRIERRKPGRVHGRLLRKARLENVVRPRAQLGSRPEVHASAAGPRPTPLVAEPLANDVVDVDVGAAEPVDRLLRVADDEERPWAKRHLPPVWRIRP